MALALAGYAVSAIGGAAFFGSVAAATVATYALGYGSMLLAAAGAQSSQKRKARRQYNASLEDRTSPVRSSDAPRSITYGRTRVSGPVAYVANHGTKREQVAMNVVLGAHRFDAIEDVWFDDASIGTIAFDSWAVQNGSKYWRGDQLTLTHPIEPDIVPLIAGGIGSTFTINSFAPAYTFVAVDTIGFQVPSTVGATNDLIVEGGSYTLNAPGVANPDYSVSGNVVTLLTNKAQGYGLVVTYRVAYGIAYAAAKPFLGLPAGERDNGPNGGLEVATQADTAPWTAQHVGNGIARLHCNFIYDPTIYAGGLPAVSAIVRGARVYDPRDGTQNIAVESTWKYSNNAALCCADYLRNPLGFGIPTAEIDWPAVATAANISDEWIQATDNLIVGSVLKAVNAVVSTTVPHKFIVGDFVHFPSVAGMTQISGNTYQVTAVGGPFFFSINVNSTAFGTFTSGTCHLRQRRYTCDGVVSTEGERKSNMEQLLSSMLGTCFYSGGMFILRAGAYVEPLMTLDESDLADGPMTVQSRQPRDELFNSVRGKFRDPANLYQINDFKPYVGNTALADYVEEDGEEIIYEDFEFPFTAHAIAAQRMAKLILWRARNGLVFEANWKLSALALQPGDTVYIKLKRYGWDILNANAGKIFRVVEREFSELKTIKLVLQEEASVIYSWTFGDAQVLDPAPNTSFAPVNEVQEIGVQISSGPRSYETKPDGTIVPYVEVTWPLPSAPDVHLEIGYKRTVDTRYEVISVPVGETMQRIRGVSGGEILNMYTVAVNSIGARSRVAWIPWYQVDPGLPRFTGEVPALSANLLTNASFDRGAGGWTAIDFSLPAGSTTLEKRTDGVYAVVGSPSSANIVTVSTATGAQYVGAYAEPISVTPGRRYVAYCGVIGWDTPAYVAAQVFGENDVYIAGYDGNVTPASTWEGPLRWNTPAHYQNSSVFFNAPPGARWVRFIVVGGGVWPAMTNPFNARWVSFYQPFLGEIPEGVTTLPPWDPGGHNMVGTSLLAPNAAADVFIGANTSARVDFTGAPSIVFLGPQIVAADAGSLRISVTFTLQMSANTSDVVAFIGYVTPSSAVGSKSVAAGPVLETVPANTTAIKTFNLSTSVPVTKGQSITTRLIIERKALTGAPTDSGIAEKPVSLFKAAGGVYAVDFNAVLHKR